MSWPMICCVSRWFSFYSNLFTTALTIGLLATWFMPKLWESAARVAAHFGCNRSNEVLITVIYNLLDAGKDILLGMPFSLYSTFVVEQRHGFNKQTLAIFIKDQVIGVSWAIMAPATLCNCTLIMAVVTTFSSPMTRLTIMPMCHF